MLNVHPSLDQVFLVVRPIDAPIKAREHDRLVVRPSDAVYPFVLRRAFPAGLVLSIPDSSVLLLSARNDEIPHLAPSLELTFAVVRKISGLGAEAGDELSVRPTDADLPFTLRRSFPLEFLPFVPEDAVSLRGAAELGDALASRRRHDSAPARVLSLVRRAG